MAASSSTTIRGCACEWSCEPHRGTHCHGVPVRATTIRRGDVHTHGMLCRPCADEFEKRREG